MSTVPRGTSKRANADVRRVDEDEHKQMPQHEYRRSIVARQDDVLRGLDSKSCWQKSEPEWDPKKNTQLQRCYRHYSVGVLHVSVWQQNKESSDRPGAANGLLWHVAKQNALRAVLPRRACILATRQTQSTMLPRSCRRRNVADWHAVAWLAKRKSIKQRHGCRRSSAVV
jgi:hypothetical protein